MVRDGDDPTAAPERVTAERGLSEWGQVLDGMDSASYFVSCLFTMVGISFYSPDFFWREGLYGLTLGGLVLYALVAVWCAYVNVRERVASSKAAAVVRAAAKKHSAKLHREADKRSPEDCRHMHLGRAETSASLRELVKETDEGLNELTSTLNGHVFKRWTDSEEVTLGAYHRLKKIDSWLAPHVSDQSPTSQFSMLPDAEFYRQINVVFPNFFTWIREASLDDMLHLRRLFQSILSYADAPDAGFQDAIVPGDQSSVLYWLINVAEEYRPPPPPSLLHFPSPCCCAGVAKCAETPGGRRWAGDERWGAEQGAAGRAL